MLGAMARAYAVLGDEKYLAAAEKNLAFIQAKLWDGKTKDALPPLARWGTRQRPVARRLCVPAFGVIDLYEATLEPKHLDFAVALAAAMIAKFYDRRTAVSGKALPARRI
jgi:uncharacterized protein YyaL (SSP411 family)